MKKGTKIISLLLFVVLIISAAYAALIWKSREDLRFAAKLGKGINLGNAMDSTGLWEYKPDEDELSYENYWGNPDIDSTQMRAIREAGFNSVRIPITWEDHIDGNGIISERWMQRAVDVVDMALAEDLYVVIDTHHEEWLNLETEREDEICEMYRKVWTQIAERFADYDDRLIFEGMNEARLRDSEHEWDEGTPELRAMVNRLNETFVDTVRAAGGINGKRYLMISAYATNTETQALEDLKVPDGNIIVAVHMYKPYSFCQDEEGTDEWSVSVPKDTEQIESIFADLKRLFIDKKIPVAVTEFGCIDKENEAARAEWAGFYAKLASDNGIPCFWWDNGSTYQLLDRENGVWLHPDILDAIIVRE